MRKKKKTPQDKSNDISRAIYSFGFFLALSPHQFVFEQPEGFMGLAAVCRGPAWLFSPVIAVISSTN